MKKHLTPRNRISDSWGLSAVSQYVSFTSEMMYLNILPFVDRFPKDTELYSIMTTKLSDKSAAD